MLYVNMPISVNAISLKQEHLNSELLPQGPFWCSGEYSPHTEGSLSHREYTFFRVWALPRVFQVNTFSKNKKQSPPRIVKASAFPFFENLSFETP